MNADHKQQHKVDLIIEEILNKSFTPKENKKGVRLCWLFCMEIVKELNGHLRNSPKGLSQIPKAKDDLDLIKLRILGIRSQNESSSIPVEPHILRKSRKPRDILDELVGG